MKILRWGFSDCDESYLELEIYPNNVYLFSGSVHGKDIHDENHEDFCWRSKEELEAGFENFGLSHLLDQVFGTPRFDDSWKEDGF